jgi:hypothetical protein
LVFYLVAPGVVGIDGPADVLAELSPEIDARELELVAIVEEFSADTPAVQAANAILTGRYTPAPQPHIAHRVKRGAKQVRA